MRIALRSLGWLLVGASLLVGAHLVRSLWWTSVEADRAQAQLLDEWVLEVGAIDDRPAPVPSTPAVAPVPPPVAVGGAVAAVQFRRPGAADPPVHDEPLLIVEGVTDEALRAGPGHYPGTAQPGEMGNFAVAGHRTTAGAPFYDLDQVRVGDEIHVTDRSGHRWIYEVLGQEIVGPDADHVLRPDPLGLRRPMLTFTTCNPRWSNRERLIVYAQLRAGQDALGATAGETPA